MIPLLTSADILFALAVVVGLATLAAGLYVLARTRRQRAQRPALAAGDAPAAVPGATGEASVGMLID